MEAQKEGQLSFLKANITSVMDQIDTLVNLKEKFHNDVQKYGTEPTLTLEKAIKGNIINRNSIKVKQDFSNIGLVYCVLSTTCFLLLFY